MFTISTVYKRYLIKDIFSLALSNRSMINFKTQQLKIWIHIIILSELNILNQRNVAF